MTRRPGSPRGSDRTAQHGLGFAGIHAHEDASHPARIHPALAKTRSNCVVPVEPVRHGPPAKRTPCIDLESTGANRVDGPGGHSRTGNHLREGFRERSRAFGEQPELESQGQAGAQPARRSICLLRTGHLGTGSLRDDRPNLAGQKKRVCFVHSLGPCFLGMFELNTRIQKSGIFNPWGARCLMGLRALLLELGLLCKK